jgi:UDP-N-acetylmuramoyl-L-alanyl-D-glutamate--2,6-diaminopimelate ligase
MMAQPRRRESRMLSALLQGLLDAPLEQDLEIGGLGLDSREIRPGELFLACRGTNGHGMDHAASAVQQGAVAIAAEPGGVWPAQRIQGQSEALGVPVLLVEALGRRVSRLAARFYGKPSRSLRVIGVTGTNGKTSCTHFMAEALGQTEPCGVIGTLGAGLPGALVPGRHTTPDPVELQGHLARLRDRGIRSVAMEVSSHALDQHRTAAVAFETAVLTNLSRDHLDYHGTMDHYAASKLRLFTSPGLPNAVINLDDPFGRVVMASMKSDTRVIVYGIGGRSLGAGIRVHGFIWAESVLPSRSGLELRLHTRWGNAELLVGVLGRFNASNLLASLGALMLHGMSLKQGVESLRQVHGVPGRMELYGGGEGPMVVVDYAHTPHALEQVLIALRDHCTGRLSCVFGCGGERDRGKRPQMGAVAERLADRLVLTDDNPRGEEPGRILADILGGLDYPDRARVIRDRGEAIRAAITEAGRGDLIAVCGKGHEDYQLVGDLRLPFSDAEQVRQALAERAS